MLAPLDAREDPWHAQALHRWQLCHPDEQWEMGKEFIREWILLGISADKCTSGPTHTCQGSQGVYEATRRSVGIQTLAPTRLWEERP